jgi:hypothetical protein
VSVETELVNIARTFDAVCLTLEKILDHLETTQDYKTSHGVHFDAVEARKLLESLRA